jgi:hypothetical protein
MNTLSARPLPVASAIALAWSLAALPAYAAPTEAQMQAMEARLKAMEARLESMQKALDAAGAAGAAGAAAAAPAGGWGQGPNAPARLTQGEADTLKQKVAKQELQLGELYEASRSGPLAGLSITGYVDPSYVYNRNAGTSSFLFLSGGDPYTYDASSVGDLYIKFKKTFGEGTYAPNIDITIKPYRGYGAFTTNSGGSTFGNIFNIALLTVPLDDTTQFTAGYTPSFATYEYQESTITNTMSHGLLYDWSAPGTYMGIGLNKNVGNWYFKTFLGNEEYRSAGAISADGKQKNRTPTITGRFDYGVSSALYVGGSVSLGRNSLFDNGDGTYGYQATGTKAFGNKAYGQIDMTYTTADQVFNAEFDYGRLQNGAWNGEEAVWWGISLLGHQKWSTESLGRIGGTVRLDYLNNSRNGGGGGGIYLGGGGGVDGANGFGIGQDCFANSVDNGKECKGANRTAVTFAFLMYPTEQITLKAEYRRDFATERVFARGNGLFVKDNDVLGMQVVYAF